MGNSRSKHDTGNVYNVNIRQKHRSRFAKLWNYVLSEKKLRARLFVMNHKNVCDDDFIEHLKNAFIRSLSIGIVSNHECDMPLDTKILIEMADILRFADFDPEHKDARIVRAISELHERIQELGVKVASLETTYYLLPEYRSLFLRKNILEYLVLGASDNKHLILRIIDELLRDLHPEDHDPVVNLSSRLCYHLLAQRDAGSAHVVIHCLTRVVGLMSGSRHHLEDVLEEPMAKSIIGVVREIDVENDASFVSVAVDFMLHVTRLYPPVVHDWLKNDVKSCLRKLLTGVEPQETDEMKFILKDRILINKIMKFVSALIPPLPNEKKFELLNDYDNNNQHVLAPMELLKNRPIQEFMATMFTVVLHVAQVDRCNRDHLLTVLKMICHSVNHSEMFEEHLVDIVKHISSSIHSDDIIIRSASLSIATEITNRDSKMAIRHFFRHGFIEGVLKLVDETEGPTSVLPASKEFHRVDTQSSILVTLILKRRDEAFSLPYRELGSVRDLLNESMSDRALEMFKGVLTNRTILRADLVSSDILGTLVAYFLPRCTCLSGFEYPEQDNCMNCRYRRLKNFAKIFLEIKDDYSLPPLKDLNLSAFASLVKILNISASRINTDGLYPKDIDYFVSDFKPAFHPNNVDPRLGKCVLIDSALGPTLCEKNLKRRFSGQVIRLLTICHALNRSLGVLFEVMNYPPLLSRDAFLNRRMQDQAKHFLRENRGKNSIEIPLWFIKNVTKCPFMVTLNTRKNLFDAYLRSLGNNNDNQSDTSQFEVDRGNSAEHRGLLDRINGDDGTWYVNFKDELATGLGPSKEFFSLVSRSYQMFHLGLWTGDAVGGEGGNEYVQSPCGLFPSPKVVLATSENTEFIRIGKLLGKSIIDRKMLDLPLSKATYKFLLGQPLGLADIRDIRPSVYEFIAKLVDVLKEKRKMEENFSCTPAQIFDMVDSLKFEGSDFKDLCIDFTLPGRPDIPLKEHGDTTMLSPHNIEEYIHLVAYWLLHRGVGVQLTSMRESFRQLVPDSFHLWFYPEELDRVFCGDGQWTTKELDKFVRVEGFARDYRSVRFFLRAMDSLRGEERKKFLMFVTSSPKLPCSGLKYLNPPLTIRRMHTYDGPDGYLPSVHTCTNTIMVPSYSNQAVAKLKLLQAMELGLDAFQNA